MTDKALQVIADRLNELGVPHDVLYANRGDAFIHDGWILVTKDVGDKKLWLQVVPSKVTLGELFKKGLSDK